MEVSITLLPFVILSIILALANLESYSQAFRWLAYLSLISLNLLLATAGLIGLVLPITGLPGIPPEATDAYVTLLRGMGITGLLAFLPFIRPLRQWLARVIKIDPASTVHLTALVYAVYLLGLGISQQPLLTNPEVVDGLDLQLTSDLAWAQGLGMVLLALSGLGLFIRRSWRDTALRLGLAWPAWRDLLAAAVAVIVLFAMQIGVVLLWRALDPAGFAQLESANNLLFGQFSPNLAAAFTIGFTAAVGEELVFRGALQPPFGLVLTALLFTLVHSQYGFSPASLLILLIALVLGVLRKRRNLTVCILTHFGYNFLSVMLPTLGQ
jgi:hypothetical protein